MDISREFVEKRRFGRLTSRVGMQYRRVGGSPDIPVGGLAYDISGGGIRLSSGDFIPRSSKLVVQLPLEYPVKTINALARVVWVQKKSYSEQYDLGLEFVDINPADQKDLINYIERSLVHTNMV